MFCHFSGKAQNYVLTVEYLDSFNAKAKFPSLDNLGKEPTNALNELMSYWIENGHLAMFYNLIQIDSTNYRAEITIGSKYGELLIDTADIPNDWPLRYQLKKGAKLSINQWRDYRNLLIDYAVNNGYPFAEVKLTHLKRIGNSLLAHVQLDLSKKFAYGQIALARDVNLNLRFLSAYLDVEKGHVYKHKSVLDISRKLSNLSFVVVNAAPKVLYLYTGEAAIILDLTVKKNSSANGLVAIAQATNPADPPLITGEFDLNLRNLAGNGIAFNFHFERFRPQSQAINLDASLPYLFGKPYEIDGGFELNRFDSTFFTLKSNIGASYLFSSQKKIRLYYDYEQVSTNNTQISESEQINVNGYGLGGFFNFQDRLYNPTVGLKTVFSLAIGNKTGTLRGEEIQNINYKYRATLNYVLPIYGKLVFVPAIQTRGVVDQTFVQGQAIWVGGFSNFRAYNQNSLPVQHFQLFTADFRWLVNSISYANLFTEYIQYQLLALNGNALGYGVGYNFGIGNGIFSINYAIPAQNGFSITNGILNFGVASYF
ncbi:MAG: hypothetical protein KDC92_04710 [Bacteroidetes bacterium]|nr:hypothetical protein [Bacteroidota bacterium]